MFDVQSACKRLCTISVEVTATALISRHQCELLSNGDQAMQLVKHIDTLGQSVARSVPPLHAPPVILRVDAPEIYGFLAEWQKFRVICENVPPRGEVDGGGGDTTTPLYAKETSGQEEDQGTR